MQSQSGNLGTVIQMLRQGKNVCLDGGTPYPRWGVQCVQRGIGEFAIFANTVAGRKGILFFQSHFSRATYATLDSLIHSIG